MPRLDIGYSETVSLLRNRRNADIEQLADLGIGQPVFYVLEKAFLLEGRPDILSGRVETGLVQGSLEGLGRNVVLNGKATQSTLAVAIFINHFSQNFRRSVKLGSFAAITQYLSDYAYVDPLDFRIFPTVNPYSK